MGFCLEAHGTQGFCHLHVYLQSCRASPGAHTSATMPSSPQRAASGPGNLAGGSYLLPEALNDPLHAKP